MKQFYTVALLFIVTLFLPNNILAQCVGVNVENISNPGPYQVATLTEANGIRNGANYLESTIYYPTNATAPFASIAIVPGFNSGPETLVEWGPFYASHGIVAIIIGTNNRFSFPDARATALIDALETLRQENSRVGSPLKDKLDTNKFGVSGWSMGGGGAQRAAVSDNRIKGVIALCPWLDSNSSLNHSSPVLIFSGQNDPTAPPAQHADLQYNATPNTTNKLLFEVANGGHDVANSPNRSNGMIGKIALSWFKLYVEKNDCYCSLKTSSLLINSTVASKIVSNFECVIPISNFKKSAIVFNESGDGTVQSGRIYSSSVRGASRESNGSGNTKFGNQGEWSVDLTVSERTPVEAAQAYGNNEQRLLNGGFGALARASFVAGNYTRAHSLGAVALGFLNIAGKAEDISGTGDFNGINGDNVGQFAVGWRNIASGNGAVAMGHGTTASGAWSFSHGNTTTASGTGSVAFGLGTSASADGSFAVGKYNLTSDAAFVVGNGSSAGSKSDAFVVNTNGSAVISGDLSLNSDMRLKAGIMSLGSTITKLLQIDGKRYVMKTDKSNQKIGLLAQDVQAVFPELVKEANNEEGTLSVNYQGLIPVLINAIKEQQQEINELKKIIKNN